MSDYHPPSASSVTSRAFFAWHPVYQGRDVESVRREITDDLRRDQHAYELALRAAELDESGSLQTVVKLDGRWAPFDLGWAEADVAQLADYVMAIELERDRQQRMARPKELRDRVAPPAIDHAGPDGADGDGDAPESAGFPISRRWQVIVSVVLVVALIALLISQLF